MLKFENQAWRGIRLVGKTDNGVWIEIGTHHTAEEGDFFVQIYSSEFKLFRNFREVIEYVKNRFGENNLKEFEQRAIEAHEEMYKDRYVVKWKKRKKPLL
jgi:small-conductance mechanosensitive channel